MKKQDIVIAVLVAVAALFLCTYKSSLYSELNRLNLTPRPEPFTELYLNDFTHLSNSLPHTIKPGEKLTFSFTIHNVEGKSTSYPYIVYFIDEKSATTTIDSGSVVLADNASASVSESYTFKAPQNQVTVFISLMALNQSVHFFVPTKE